MSPDEFDLTSEYVTEQMDEIVNILQEYDHIQIALILSHLPSAVLQNLDYSHTEAFIQ